MGLLLLLRIASSAFHVTDQIKHQLCRVQPKRSPKENPMPTQLITRFAPVIQALSLAELKGSPTLNAKLQLALDGNIEVCYAPLEYINRQARVVIVGITPGRTQWLNALAEVRRQLDSGADIQSVLKAAKTFGAFSGTMRPNLISLLDSVGIQRWLCIQSCEELFGNSSSLVQTASLLRNPVFIDGENYNGKPNMTRHPLLREQLISTFSETIKALPDAVFVPSGDTVTEGLTFLADKGLLAHKQILDGLPHPSGANAERIAYFVGRKDRSALSVKTSPDKLDRARERLTNNVRALV